MNRKRVESLLEVAGLTAIVAGVALVSVAAALIVAGLLVAAAVNLPRSGDR